jgi:hypothetical protein
MDVGTSLVADGKAAEAMEPRNRPLDDPSVPTEALAVLDASARDARSDAAGTTDHPTEDVVVGLVGVKLVRARARSAAADLDRRQLVEHRPEHLAVVQIGAREVRREWDAAPVYDDVVLGSELSAVRRVRAGLFTPPFARTLDPSTLTRDQSILSSRPSSSSRT